MHHEALIIVLVSACLLVNLITLAVVVVNLTHNRRRADEQQYAKLQVAAARSSVHGIVFCRNCGNQFDSTLDVCPHCKTTR
jgi:NADH:ubiquinone oxidoreductase subunit K